MDDGLSVDGDSNISADEVGSSSMDELSSVVRVDVGSWALSVPEGWNCWGELDIIGITIVALSLEFKTEETIALGLTSVVIVDSTIENGGFVESGRLKVLRDSGTTEEATVSTKMEHSKLKRGF